MQLFCRRKCDTVGGGRLPIQQKDLSWSSLVEGDEGCIGPTCCVDGKPKHFCSTCKETFDTLADPFVLKSSMTRLFHYSLGAFIKLASDEWNGVLASNKKLHDVSILLLKKRMGQPRPLSRLFLSFQTNITILTTNKCEKCPSSIRHRDLNSHPSDYKYSPLTTRAGLPPNDVSMLFLGFPCIVGR